MLTEARNRVGQILAFVLICHSVILIRFIAVKKNLVEKKVDLLNFRRKIENVYYHHFKRCPKSASSFLAPRKSVKVSSGVHYVNNSHCIDKGNQWKCGSRHKTAKYFCEKLTLNFNLNVSKYFIKNRFILWFMRLKIFN